ncbi:MAG TPA: DNRLRE domain-containing protein [Candidatus Dormibacteraeota bacterium]|nr:DNRLRE domain-containing protein [Candidatus Dormibacteraeota bacterium]
MRNERKIRRFAKVTCLALGALLIAGPIAVGRERKILQKKSTAPADPQTRAADAWIDQANTGTNHGTDATLQVSSQTGNKNQRALVEFDLSSLTNSGIKLATLSLFMTTAPSASRTYQARRMTSLWKESDVTWANRISTFAWGTAGGDNDGLTTQTATTGTANNTTISWDVTAAVQQWFGANTPIANYGTMILDANENNLLAAVGAVFASKEATTEANRPSLTVEFVQNVQALTATAGTAQVKLSWSYPSAIGTVLSATNGVLIVRQSGGTVPSTVVPTDGTVYSRNAGCTNVISTATVVFVSSSLATSFNDSAAGDNADCPPANDTVYAYKVFAKDAANNYTESGASSQFVPFTAANPSATVTSQWSTKWVAPTGVTNLAAPGISPGNVVVLPTNSNIITGIQPANGTFVFTPFSTAAGISGRPPVLDLGFNSIGFGVSYTADAQGFVYATDIATGNLLWMTNPTGSTANGFLGGAGTFVVSTENNLGLSAYTRTTDLVILGTNNTTTTTANQVDGLDGNTGTVAWSYVGGGTNSNMDIVTSTPLVDYANNAVWVTSHSNGGTTQPSLWKFNPNNTGTRLLASANLNNISNSASLSYGADLLFVGNDSGTLYAVNTSISGAGATAAASLATGDTQVIGSPLIYGKSSPYTVIISTATKVRAVKYTKGSATFTTTGTGTWTTTMPGTTACTPSSPIGYDGLSTVYVGCTDGTIYQLDVTTGAITGSRFVRNATTLGDATIDVTLSLLIFGTSSSRVYAMSFPF